MYVAETVRRNIEKTKYKTMKARNVSGSFYVDIIIAFCA